MGRVSLEWPRDITSTFLGIWHSEGKYVRSKIGLQKRNRPYTPDVNNNNRLIFYFPKMFNVPVFLMLNVPVAQW